LELGQVAAIFQAHLTGNELKVFAEFFVEDCQDYTKTSKTICLQPTQQFLRSTGKGFVTSASITPRPSPSVLLVQFRRWLESDGSIENIERLRELFQLEQLISCLDSNVRG